MRISNRFEGCVAIPVQVEIDVTNVLNIFLGPVVGAVLDWIHSHEHVGTDSILIFEPRLKAGARYRLSFGDSLNRVACRAIPHEDRSIVAGSEELPDVFRSGERARCESGVGAHGCSCLARNTEP